MGRDLENYSGPQKNVKVCIIKGYYAFFLTVLNTIFPEVETFIFSFCLTQHSEVTKYLHQQAAFSFICFPGYLGDHSLPIQLLISLAGAATPFQTVQAEMFQWWHRAQLNTHRTNSLIALIKMLGAAVFHCSLRCGEKDNALCAHWEQLYRNLN